MKRLVAALTLTLVALTTPAWAWGRHEGFRGHGRYFSPGGFVLGFGLGALVTAPYWYPAYPVPVPVPVPPPPPVYAYPVAQAYYCPNPPGYYPSVPYCYGNAWMIVP